MNLRFEKSGFGRGFSLNAMYSFWSFFYGFILVLSYNNGDFNERIEVH